MEAFRRKRINDERFALTTLQDPTLDARYRDQQIEDARRQAQVLVTAKIVPQAAAEAAVKVFREATAPSDVAEVMPYDVAEAAPYDVVEVASPDIAEATETDVMEGAAYDIVEADAETSEAAPETAEFVVVEASAPARENSIRPKRNSPARRRRATSLLPKRQCTSLERHRRKCTICAHPYRERIDDDFVNWRSALDIADLYKIEGPRCVYRHAQATGLMARRSRNVRFAAELLIEDAYTANPSAHAILQAIRITTRLDDRGRWKEPPTNVIFSSRGSATRNRSANSPGVPPSRRLAPAAVPAQHAAKRLPAPRPLATSNDASHQPEIAISNRHSPELETASKHLKTNTPCTV